MPDHGLPAGERLIASAWLRSVAAFSGRKRLLRRFAREANLLIEIVDEHDADFAGTPIRIPRIAGIEESSRHWSLYMVLDHLARVDRAIAEIISALRENMTPHVPSSIAEYEPDADAGTESIEQFQQTARSFRDTVLAGGTLRTSGRFPHPWFGPMSAHQWLALAAIHHGIHRRQARKIIAMLGPT